MSAAAYIINSRNLANTYLMPISSQTKFHEETMLECWRGKKSQLRIAIEITFPELDLNVSSFIFGIQFLQETRYSILFREKCFLPLSPIPCTILD